MFLASTVPPTYLVRHVALSRASPGTTHVLPDAHHALSSSALDGQKTSPLRPAPSLPRASGQPAAASSRAPTWPPAARNHQDRLSTTVHGSRACVSALLPPQAGPVVPRSATGRRSEILLAGIRWCALVCLDGGRSAGTGYQYRYSSVSNGRAPTLQLRYLSSSQELLLLRVELTSHWTCMPTPAASPGSRGCTA